MSTLIIEFLIVLAYVLVGGALCVGLVRNIGYRITFESLIITWMGLPIRRIPLEDIKSISTKRVFWAEIWCNTFCAENRRLVIERNSGLFTHLVISPPYRFVFRAELLEARTFLMEAKAIEAVATPATSLLVQRDYMPAWHAQVASTVLSCFQHLKARFAKS